MFIIIIIIIITCISIVVVVFAFLKYISNRLIALVILFQV